MTTRKMLTNTKKWTQDVWFRKLNPDMKLFWLYINDTCDHAGFWKVDIELAEVCIGTKLKENEIEETFRERIKIIDDDLWWIKDFCLLLSKKLLVLSTENKAHKSSVELLMKYGVYQEYVENYCKRFPGEAKAKDGLSKANDGLKVKVNNNVPVEEKILNQVKIPVGEKISKQPCPGQSKTAFEKGAFQEARRRH